MNAYRPIPAPPRPAPRRAAPHRTPFKSTAALVLGVLVLLVTPYSLILPKVAVRGAVLDEGGRPVAGARIRSETSGAMTAGDGTFAMERVGLLGAVRVEADGYESASARVWPAREVRVGLTPRTFSLTVRDAETGDVVPEAQVKADPAHARRFEPGRFEIGPARSDTAVAIRAPGYAESIVAYAGEARADARLQRRYAGTLADAASGKPIANGFVSFEGGWGMSGPDGAFDLPSRPAGPVRVLAPGYRRAEVDFNADPTLAIRLQPFAVKALYLSFYGVGHQGLRGNALELAEKTEVNALVIDVKGDRGWIAYQSDVPLAEQIGANDEHTIPNVDELLATLKQRGIYTIARIVAFKDDKLARNGARAGVDVAIKDAGTGQPWIDGEGLGWVDPFRPEVWEYNIALAREAARKGFDEIQFDYIRFPTDPSRETTMGAARYSKPISEASRIEAVTTFLRQAREEVRRAGAFLGVDVFGYVTLDADDIGIGQQLEAVAEVVDYVCPMVYPSAYSAGLVGKIGYPQVVSRPYDVVYESMKRARERAAGRGAVMRPWLQYFDDYPWETKKAYNAAEIAAQRKGAADAGSIGWMMWDPSNRYSRGGFAPKS